MGVIARQSFKASVSNYVGVILGFISTIFLFPLFFKPVELGAVRIFIELGATLSAFALMGTNYSINRFFPYFRTEDQKHHGFFFWTILFPIVGILMLSVLLFFFGNAFFTFINEDALKYQSLFHILLLLIITNVYMIITEAISANHGRIAFTNLSKEVIMRILIIFSGTMYYFKYVDFVTCIWMIVLSYLTSLTINIIFIRKLTKINLKPDFNFLRNNKKLVREIMLFTLVLMFSSLSSLVIPKIDFFLVSSIQKNLGFVAIYSIAFNLATFIEIPKRTILQISVPIISKHFKENNIKEIEIMHKKNGSIQLITSSLLFVLIWMNLDNLFELMPQGDYYKQGKWVVFVLGMAKILDSVNCLYSPIVSNSKLYKWVPIIIFFNSIVAIWSSFYFITKYGYLGGAFSNMTAILLLNSFCLILIQKYLKINPFEAKQLKIVLLFALFLSITFIGNWFPNPIVDGIIRTSILGLSYIYLIYRFNFSEDFNQLIINKINPRNFFK